MTTLNAEIKGDIKNKDLREQGFIPAVLYGGKSENTQIKINQADFVKLYREVGESATFELKTEKGSDDVIIQDLQVDPVSGAPIHVDFLAIEKGKALTVTVPLEFTGEAPAESLGGTVVKVAHDIEIEVLPKDIPENIEVNLELLKTMDDSITVEQLSLPESAKFTGEEGTVVATMTAQKEESEEETEALDLSSIEVEAKGKEESTEEASE